MCFIIIMSSPPQPSHGFFSLSFIYLFFSSIPSSLCSLVSLCPRKRPVMVLADCKRVAVSCTRADGIMSCVIICNVNTPITHHSRTRVVTHSNHFSQMYTRRSILCYTEPRRVQILRRKEKI